MWRNIIPTIFEFKIVHFQVGWNKVEKQEPGWMFLPIMGSILKHDCDLREDLCSAATKWETWSGLIRRQIVGSDSGWVRKGQETFLGDINITSWLRHCQAELTRNNIDIANPDCPLVWHFTSYIKSRRLEKISRLVRSLSVPGVWVSYFVSRWEETNTA